MQRSVMLRTLLAAACVAALTAAVATSSAGGATKVLFPAKCEVPTYKPRSIVVTCGDANTVLTKIVWDKWNSSSAAGEGTAKVNECKPNCAAGKFRNHPASVQLSKPKDCGRVTQFTKLVLLFEDAKAGSSGQKVSEKFPCGGTQG
jgi:hypothetical protein